ncbi:MAG: glycosyltransferase [Candidatus Omnitrophota bacterium]
MLSTKKVLLLYISILSGHHRAAMAIERALKFLDPDVQVFSINSFNYTNPILERVINRVYMGIIKKTPEVWEYLYDNPKIVKNTQNLKELIHRHNSSKMKGLIEDFKPDVIACTQAFPCGMVADYKSTFSENIPLVGVLTDFCPHSYWIYESVDCYVVASYDAKSKLLENGVSQEKIFVYGIPIDISFMEKLDAQPIFDRHGLKSDIKTVLVMGGSSGYGPIKRIVAALDRINTNIQIIIVTGTNANLYSHFNRRIGKFRNKVLVSGYSNNINELMTISDLIVTKPGGLTVSEALSKSLPIVIVNPIPGQEAKNTQFLTQNRAAVRADNEEELAVLVENIFRMPSKLKAMKEQAASLGKPSSALNIAKLILGL